MSVLVPVFTLALLAATVFEARATGDRVVGVTVDHGLQDGSAQIAQDAAEAGIRAAEVLVCCGGGGLASGIALTLLPSFYAHGSFGGAPTHDGQRRFLCTVDRFGALMSASRKAISKLPGANIGIAPHSLRAVSPDELTAMPVLAGDGPIHIHVAEQTKEVTDCLAWSGARPVEWLLANAPVDARWCLIHATHVTEAEWRGVVDRGAAGRNRGCRCRRDRR